MIEVYYRMTDAAEAQKLQQVCRNLHMESRSLTAADLNQTLAQLVGAKLMPLAKQSTDAKAPMFYALPEIILFSGVSSERLDAFLAAYKSAGIHPVKLKAMLTPTNMSWSLYQLVEHLKEEVG